jgi:hypothetical protein
MEILIETFEFKYIELDSNSIEEKHDPNWCRGIENLVITSSSTIMVLKKSRSKRYRCKKTILHNFSYCLQHSLFGIGKAKGPYKRSSLNQLQVSHH